MASSLCLLPDIVLLFHDGVSGMTQFILQLKYLTLKQIAQKEWLWIYEMLLPDILEVTANITEN